MKKGLPLALQYTIGFAIVGIFITLLVVYVEQNMLTTYKRNQSFINLGDNLKNKSTKAHRLLEEQMAGDASINFEKDVVSLLESSKQILQAAHDGKESELGKFEKIDDPRTAEILKRSIYDSHKLLEAAKERYAFKTKAPVVESVDSVVQAGIVISEIGTGEKLDQQVDVAYEKLQATLSELVLHIDAQVDKDTAFFNALSWVSVGALVLAFGVICFLVYRLQSGNDTMTAANVSKLHDENKRLDSISEFVGGISEGNYNIELKDIDGSNGIGGTLVAMRNKLRENVETEKRRNWATSGLAQIGDILRTNTNSATDLYDNIIRFLVRYTESNQGGLFIFNDDIESETYLELAACYAYERKKFLTKKVAIGEGLVGQCYIEGERIYLLDVPKEYVSITSGLGGSNPSALILVPMKLSDAIYGVIELASFQKYHEYEIELIEKLAESIASTIATVRTNESTRILLEKTQQQAEEMRAQEEEMRQNMEELEATQEEMSRKERKYLLKIDRMESALKEISPEMAHRIIHSEEEVNLVVQKIGKGESGGSHKKMSYSKEDGVPQSEENEESSLMGEV